MLVWPTIFKLHLLRLWPSEDDVYKLMRDKQMTFLWILLICHYVFYTKLSNIFQTFEAMTLKVIAHGVRNFRPKCSHVEK